MMKGLIANDEYAVCLLNAKSFVFEQYIYTFYSFSSIINI